MSKYKIDSIGRKAIYYKEKGEIITFYALVCAVDKPDFQFSLKLGFSEWIGYARKYHEYAEVTYQEFIERGPMPRYDSKYYSDLSCFVNRKRLVLMVFEEIFDLEKEAKKAKVLSSSELERLKKILHQVDPSKSVYRRKGVLFNEIYELIAEGIYKELLLKYPILHSIDNLKKIVKEGYESNSDGFFEDELVDLIRGLEKKSEQVKGPIPTVSE